ncbi:MAG: DUF4129 domain-containing protein [Chloroflexota bacterium]
MITLRLPKAVFLLIGFVLYMVIAPFVMAQEPVAHDAYWAELAALRERVANGETLAVAGALKNVTAVFFPDGQIIPVDHQFLIAELKRDEADAEQVLAFFDALLAMRPDAAELGQTAFDGDTLAFILQQPEFQYEESEPSSLQQWWQELRERFWAFTGRFFPDPDTPVGRLAQILPTYGGALLLVIVLGLALRSMLSGLVAEANLRMESAEAELLTADSAFARAQELSGRGDYRTAVRYLYLSALLLLEEQGLLRYDRSRTNREYLRSVAHKPELARILREVVEVFDSVWYGYQPLDKAEYDAYVQRVEALKKQR